MLREIRAFVARLATAAGIPDAERHQIVLATNEAATNPTFKFEGGNRFAGVVMRRPTPDWGKYPSFTAGRWDPSIFCSGACTTPLDLLSINASGENTESGPYRVMSAGDYRLYLLTSGAPARVTLHFPQLPAGTTTLTPEVPTRVDADVLPRRDPLPGAQEAVFGETNTVDTDALVFLTSLTYVDAWLATNTDICSYKGQALPVAFTPTCPGRLANDPHEEYQPFPFVNQSGTTGPAYAFSTTYPLFVPAGTWSVGGNSTSAADVLSVGWAQAWISLDGAPSKTGSTARRRGSRGRT